MPSRLKELLLEANISHADFARKAGYSQNTISKACKGRVAPSTMIKITNTYNDLISSEPNIGPSDIFSNYEEKRKEYLNK